MDPSWHFAREWEEMKKRVERLERKVYWLEQYKKQQEEEIYKNDYKN
jgi:hypothetical protein